MNKIHKKPSNTLFFRIFVYIYPKYLFSRRKRISANMINRELSPLKRHLLLIWILCILGIKSHATQGVDTTDVSFRHEYSQEKAAAMPPDCRLLIKTNLLYDVVLMPSLEVEYRIGKRWTVNLEGYMAWWHNDGKHRYYQAATISPEGRWWFGQKKGSLWHGHYLGLFGGFTWYDIENGKRGYQGEAETVGISYGYLFPIGKRLSLETGVSIGYLHSEYEEYLPEVYAEDTHYVYQQTKRLNYSGPLKLKLALVWRLWKTDKKKGGGK